MGGTTNQLKSIAAAGSGGAERLAAAAAEMSNASNSLAHGASEQAAPPEETSASAGQISAMTRRNAWNAQHAADAMAASAHGIEEADSNLEAMAESEEVACQTDILALNAAVEAARAGAAGSASGGKAKLDRVASAFRTITASPARVR